MKLLALARVLGALVLAALALAVGTPLPNVAVRKLSPAARLEPADAIVVLGGGVDEAGTLGNSSLRRVVHGIELYHRGLAPRVLVFGPGEKTDSPREGDVRAQLARDFKVPEGAVLVDRVAPTTRAEAAATGRLLKPLGVKRVLLVTGVQHQLRAGGLFAREGFEVLPAPVNEVAAYGSNPEDRLRLTRALLQEAVGRLYYRLAGYL